ncbi:MAG: hypothetical protein JWO14_1067 [Solirubrobacterales bacterium]|nr:hypothetical protein [Solirubrobacterales bacterium]
MAAEPEQFDAYAEARIALKQVGAMELSYSPGDSEEMNRVALVRATEASALAALAVADATRAMQDEMRELRAVVYDLAKRAS